MALTMHHLPPRFKKKRVEYTSFPLWAFVARCRVNFTLTFTLRTQAAVSSYILNVYGGHIPKYHSTVRSESRCALRLRSVNLVVSIEVAGELCLMS
jgi:hypothetical protein